MQLLLHWPSLGLANLTAVTHLLLAGLFLQSLQSAGIGQSAACLPLSFPGDRRDKVPFIKICLSAFAGIFIAPWMAAKKLSSLVPGEKADSPAEE